MALVLLCNPIVCGRASAQNISEDLTDEQNSGNAKNIVVYFSRIGEQYNVGVIEKGNTAIVAEMIAEATGADLYEILPADDHYPMTYKELTDVALQEQREGARPAFFEGTPLSGKTLVPFSTHAGSGLSGFDRTLAAAYPDCTVEKGLAVAGTDAQKNPDKAQISVDKWLEELGF